MQELMRFLVAFGSLETMRAVEAKGFGDENKEEEEEGSTLSDGLSNQIPENSLSIKLECRF